MGVKGIKGHLGEFEGVGWGSLARPSEGAGEGEVGVSKREEVGFSSGSIEGLSLREVVDSGVCLLPSEGDETKIVESLGAEDRSMITALIQCAVELGLSGLEVTCLAVGDAEGQREEGRDFGLVGNEVVGDCRT